MRQSSVRISLAKRLAWPMAVVTLLFASVIALSPARAYARKNGIAVDGCTGCHGSEKTVTVSASLTAASFKPGDEIIIDVSVGASDMTVAGLFVAVEDGAGNLGTLAGEGLAASSGGLTHVVPKPSSAGVAQFRFSWRSPNTIGATRFSMYAVAGNGDGKRTGDFGGEGTLDVVYGCEAQAFYYDGDGDGFGRDEAPTMRCAGQAPAAYAAVNSDCDDFRSDVYPQAQELCNGRDDNCNGEVDEGAIPITLWPDQDGDGYYKERSGQSIMGCVPTPGYAAEWGDCDETNASVHRDAEEVCNLLDDDCDGRADEGVRPQCGEGWCRRESPTCSMQDCVEGLPAAELCNGVDDDCNAEIDEGVDCGAGALCIEGVCRSASDVTGTPGTAGTPEPGAETPRGDRDQMGDKAPVANQTCALTMPLQTGAAGMWVGYGAVLGALAFARRRYRAAKYRSPEVGDH